MLSFLISYFDLTKDVRYIPSNSAAGHRAGVSLPLRPLSPTHALHVSPNQIAPVLAGHCAHLIIYGLLLGVFSHFISTPAWRA